MGPQQARGLRQQDAAQGISSAFILLHPHSSHQCLPLVEPDWKSVGKGACQCGCKCWSPSAGSRVTERSGWLWHQVGHIQHTYIMQEGRTNNRCIGACALKNGKCTYVLSPRKCRRGLGFWLGRWITMEGWYQGSEFLQFKTPSQSPNPELGSGEIHFQAFDNAFSTTGGCTKPGQISPKEGSPFLTGSPLRMQKIELAFLSSMCLHKCSSAYMKTELGDSWGLPHIFTRAKMLRGRLPSTIALQAGS